MHRGGAPFSCIVAMVFKKRAASAAVAVHELAAGGWGISGGHLCAEEAWLPSSLLTIIEGEPFLRMDRSSRQLSRLCGCPLTQNGFLDDLHALRDAKCLEIIEKSSDRSNDRQVKRDMHGPPTLEFMAPVYSVHHAPVRLTVAFEANFKYAPSIQATPASLMYVIEAINATQGEGVRFRKRSTDERPALTHPEVRWSNQRTTLSVAYRDTEGRTHMKHCKPRLLTPEQVAASENWLHDFYTQPHHGGDISSNDMDDASSPASCAGEAETPSSWFMMHWCLLLWVLSISLAGIERFVVDTCIRLSVHFSCKS